MDLLHKYISTIVEAAVAPKQARSEGLALHVGKSSSAWWLTLFDPVSAYNEIVDQVNEGYEEHENLLNDISPKHRDIYSNTPIFLSPRVEDIIANHVYAFIFSVEEWDDAKVITASRGKNKYGPLIYDIAMTVMGPITPHRTDVSPAARKIWKHYYYKRSDVTKRPVMSLHKQKWLNQVYTLKKPIALGRLTNASDTFIRDTEKLYKEFNVSLHDNKSIYQLVSLAGHEFFRRWERLNP